MPDAYRSDAGARGCTKRRGAWAGLLAADQRQSPRFNRILLDEGAYPLARWVQRRGALVGRPDLERCR